MSEFDFKIVNVLSDVKTVIYTFKAQRLCGLCMRVTILMIKQPKKVDWNEATSYVFTKHDGVEFTTRAVFK